MRCVILVALLALPSCGTISKIDKLVDSLDVSVAKINAGLTTIEKGAELLGEKGKDVVAAVGAIRDATAKADKNQDGRISGFGEVWQWLVGVLAAVLAALGIKVKGLGKQVVEVDRKRSDGARRLHDKIETVARPSGADRPRDAA